MKGLFLNAELTLVILLLILLQEKNSSINLPEQV